MTELKVVDIKLKIVRGRSSPNEKRFSYSTLVEYIIDPADASKKLVVGVIPPTYFILKQVLKEDLDDLERVIYHNIREDIRLFFQDLFLENNLLKISMRKALIETVDRVVIDTINRLREDTYNFAASIYLNNGQRLHDVMPSDAVIIALVANKNIYIDTTLQETKEKIDRQIEEKTEPKAEGSPTDEAGKDDDSNAKNLYT